MEEIEEKKKIGFSEDTSISRAYDLVSPEKLIQKSIKTRFERKKERR